MDVESAASLTALMVCAYRARASQWEHPLVVDPWAAQLAGPDGAALAARFDAEFPPMALWLALRVAYFDRLVGLAVDRLSANQIVILGAGYDTRAARLPRAGIRFFEVDHPATQAEKRERLRGLAGYPVDAATYVGCNFERDDVIDCLAAAGCSTREPTLVIWEGVVPYLTEAAVRATATRLATALDPRSVLAFDFVGKRLLTGEADSAAAQGTRAVLGDLGEPVRFGTDDILPLLAACGFTWVRTHDFNVLALELLKSYERDRQFRFQHVALAAVQPPDVGWP